MWLQWTRGGLTFALLLTCVRTQSGDGEWGSGAEEEERPKLVFASNATAESADPATSREVGDDPVRSAGGGSWPPPFFEAFVLDEEEEEEKGGKRAKDACTVNFHTGAAWARQVKAYRDEVTYLKAVQHGNQAVVENLAQYVGAEMGEQRYQDVIEENIAGVREDHGSCGGVVDKTAEELRSQLEGDSQEALAGIQKIKEESLAFEDMLRAASAIAGRLESTSKALHASLTQQLRRSLQTPRH
ncbi:uncharacterized protein si:ch211-142k18.1 [Sardina pilchardus]|uniref:uncharacterized protein si:ch211-142k18.1 n=1 Tax=Sardina pilchardus TaxID=27697 RepID=UPI002E1326BE